MYFQVLEKNNECIGIYQNGAFKKGNSPYGLEGLTWSQTPHTSSESTEYAYLYCGKDLDQACPEHLQEDWATVRNKMEAFCRSFVLSKINLREFCYADLIPQKHINDFCEVKNDITKHVFENYERPQNYDFLVEIDRLLTKIATKRVILDVSETLLKQPQRMQHFLKKMSNCDPYCRYNLFGTRTGRLSVRKYSFPILNLDKQIRSIVKPSNDFFLELDFNAAELRTLLSLSGEEQPDEDIHDWNMKNILTSCKTREEAKKMVFSWLYDENKINRALGRRYKRTATIKDYWKDNVVQTCFGREMKAERKLALNYILQSTTADMVLRQTVKVNDILKGKRSHIAFLMHDSVVIDMSRLDTGSILEMVETFSDTKLGKYKVNVKAGKDFGNLKDLVL